MSTSASSKFRFRTDYVRPFVNSVMALFAEHMGLDVTIGQPDKNAKATPRYELSAVIGLSGSVIGKVAVSFPYAVGEQMACRFLEVDELPEGVLEDCIGEMCNIIVGRAKSSVESGDVSISVPVISFGGLFLVVPVKGAPCLSIPVSTELGPASIDMSIIDRRAKAA